jgi:PadR family transcriptional regulator, regulatory protein PadR
MSERQFLGEFEELVLLAIMKIGQGAYGVPISETIEDATGKRPSTGALYTTLQRLEEKGFISSEVGEATAERGGRAKKYFKVENAGRMAVKNSHEGKAGMIQGLDWGLI